MGTVDKLPNKYGYQPRGQWEANDLDAEAEALRKRAELGGNCLFTLVGFLVTAGLLLGTGAALANDTMPILELDTVYMPYIGGGQ